MANDVIALQLPLRPRYLTVLRVTTGAIVGAISFDYDVIMQLRAAVSEAFNSAMEFVARGGWASEAKEMAVRFVVAPDKMEILITYPKEYPRHLNSEEEEESQALLNSLTDEMEIGASPDGKAVLRLVKYKSVEEA